MKKWISLLLCLCVAFSFSGCEQTTEKAIRVIDGRLSEQKLLVRMVKYLVEQNTNAKIDLMDEMTEINAYNELRADRADLCVSYDGTVLTTFMHKDPTDVPEGGTIFSYANELLAPEGLRLIAPCGINNTYAIGVPESIQKKYQLKTYSDLAAVSSELRFGAEHDFFAEEGSGKYNPLAEAYHFAFKDVRSMDLNLKYAAVMSGQLDVTIVYTTDGLNAKAKLVVLEDDQKFFPDYYGAFLVREDLFERFAAEAPELEAIIGQLEGTITNEKMSEMTYAVDVEERSPDDVAKEFLQEIGLYKGE